MASRSSTLQLNNGNLGRVFFQDTWVMATEIPELIGKVTLTRYATFRGLIF
jgi:hypothetical protein